jgi:hypothetical protein
MKKLILILVIFSSVSQLRAQEFFCEIRISTPGIAGTDRRVFDALRESVYEFMNQRQWTNLNIKIEERIEATVLITITERLSADEFKATLNVVLRRPIYKSSYNSPVLNYVDDNFQFRYIEYQPLDFSENTFMSNLTSVLGFYAYIFLGLDFDTFSLHGGEPFYQAAEGIVNAAQNSSERGWRAFDGNRNRYWLVENLRNATYRPLRQFLYEYHRLGLDIMSEKPDEGRAKILETLPLLERMYRERPGMFLLQLVVEAKRDEIINVFSQGSPQEKLRAANIMREIDPANSSRYDKITEN